MAWSQEVPRTQNRRKFLRQNTKNVSVTEFTEDYIYSAQVRDLSEGGIFLKGRVMTSRKISRLRISLGKTNLEVLAEPLYDRLDENHEYGTAYLFVGISEFQRNTLRTFLRNLN